MQTKTVLGLVGGAVVITGAVFAGTYFLLKLEEDEPVSQTSPTAPSAGSSLGVSQNSQVGQLSNQPQLNEGSVASQEQEQALPGPNEFEIYEQYANETNALYTDVVVGGGAEPQPGDQVAVVYQGWLTDGTLFDQSPVGEDGRIQAFSFTPGAGQVIRGWEEGIPGMRVGGQRRLIIPSVVGYGPNGQGSIPPNAMLIFDVQLVQVIPPDIGL